MGGPMASLTPGKSWVTAWARRWRRGTRCSSLLLGGGRLLLGHGSLLLSGGGLLLGGGGLLLCRGRLLLGLGHLGRILSVDCGPNHDGSAAPDAEDRVRFGHQR